MASESIKDIKERIRLLQEENTLLKERQGATNANRAEINKNLKEEERLRKRISDLEDVQHKKAVDASKEEADNAKGSFDLQKKLTELAKKSNKIAKSKKGIILNNFGLEAKNQKFIDAAKKASTDKEKNAYLELEKLRLDSLEELGEDSFDLDIFKSKLAEIDLPDELKTDFEDKFSAAADDAGDIKKAMDMNLPFLDKLQDLQDTADTVVTILGNTKLLGLAITGLVAKALTDFVMQAKSIRQDLGVTAKDAVGLSASMTAASKAAFLVGGDTEKAQASVQALAEATGRTVPLSTAASIQFGKIASLSGASADSLATIVELNALALGSSKEKSVADLASLEALAEQEGVLKSQVFDDVAQSAKDQALFFGKSAKEIAKAAVAMRKLGIEASALNSLAESLLDLESSISSEFELQQLFGKNINLNKAREAAFNRDAAGLAREIRMQLGGQFDLNKANFAQVQALTQAFGLSQEQLQKIIQGQDIFNSKSEEANQSLLMQLGKFVGITTAIGGAIGAILGGLGIFTAGLSLAGFKAMSAGLVTGAAIGAGVGATAFTATKMFEDAQITAKPVGSQEPNASFAVGDEGFARIDVSKSTQQALDLKTASLENTQRQTTEAIKGLEKSIVSIMERVANSTDQVGRNVRGLQD